MHHWIRGLFTRKKLVSSASAKRRAKEQDYYLKHGGRVLEELLGLCDGNCRIPIRYFSAIEIERAIKHSESKMDLSDDHLITGSLNNRLVLVRKLRWNYRFTDNRLYRDIAVTAQMSHLKNVLRLVGCSLEFEEPVMVYEHVAGIFLSDLLFNKGNHDQTRKSLLSWGNRLRISNEVASAVVFLHTEFTTPIIHRDIKPGNMIIDQNSGVAKIVDFSLSISLPPGELEVEDGVYGTYGYADPEYVTTGILTQKSDVHCFGVLLLELLTGKKVRDWIQRPDSIQSDIENDNLTESTNPEEINFENFENLLLSSVDDNFKEDNVMDSTNPEEINFENLPLNFVDHKIKEGNVMNIVDPAILEEHGIEIQQQLEDYLNLVKKCTAYERDNRPYMIHVAKELRRIDKCYRALTLGHN